MSCPLPFSSQPEPRAGSDGACAQPEKVREGSCPRQRLGLAGALTHPAFTTAAGRGEGDQGTRALGRPAGRPGLGGGKCQRRWGRSKGASAVFPQPGFCLHPASQLVCSLGKEGKAPGLKGRGSWESDVKHCKRPRISPEWRGTGVSLSAQGCKFQRDSDYLMSCSTEIGGFLCHSPS